MGPVAGVKGATVHQPDVVACFQLSAAELLDRALAHILEYENASSRIAMIPANGSCLDRNKHTILTWLRGPC